MAIIECPNCGKKVSDKAPKCPHCGYEVKANTSKDNSVIIKYAIVAGIFIVVLLVWSIVLTNIISTKVSNEVQEMFAETMQVSNSDEMTDGSESEDMDKESGTIENEESDKKVPSESAEETSNLEVAKNVQDDIPVTYDAIIMGERSVKIQVDKTYWSNNERGKQLIVELTIADVGSLSNIDIDIVGFTCEFRDGAGKLIYSKNAKLNSVSKSNLGFSYTITVDFSGSEVDWNEVNTIKLANYA